MKKVLAFILAGAMSLTMLTGCGEKYRSIDKIKESGELIMTTNATFPPFEYAGEGGQVEGVDADIAAAIAEKLGVKVKIDNVEFKSALAAVANGQADIGVAGITITEERKAQMDFSEPYATSVQYIIVKDDNDSVKTIEDLAGMKIGVQMSTTGDIIANDEINGYEGDDGKKVKGVLEGTGAEVVAYKSALLAAMDLGSQVDAVIIDKLPAENIVATNEGLKCFELVYADGSNTEEEYAVAVTKGNEELLKVVNEVIAELQESGKIEEFILKHTGAATIE